MLKNCNILESLRASAFSDDASRRLLSSLQTRNRLRKLKFKLGRKQPAPVFQGFVNGGQSLIVTRRQLRTLRSESCGYVYLIRSQHSSEASTQGSEPFAG